MKTHMTLLVMIGMMFLLLQACAPLTTRPVPGHRGGCARPCDSDKVCAQSNFRSCRCCGFECSLPVVAAPQLTSFSLF